MGLQNAKLTTSFNKVTGTVNNKDNDIIPQRQWPVAIPSIQLPLWNTVPAEVEFPVEAAPRHVWAGDVLKRIITDDVDDWTDYNWPASAMT